MGYTHYLNRPNQLDASTFALFSHSVEQLCYSLPRDIKICDGLGTGLPKFTAELVWFNGDEEEDLDHESVAIYQIHDSNRGLREQVRDFCKTNRKPYDLLVCATFISLSCFFPEVILESDGDQSEWQPAIDFYSGVFSQQPPPELIEMPGERFKFKPKADLKACLVLPLDRKLADKVNLLLG